MAMMMSSLLTAVVVSANPLPTAAQERWLEGEVAGIGNYNMGTYEACGIGALTLEGRKEDGGEFISLPPGSAFAPTDLNATEWVIALRNAGAKHALLTLSHGCGYTLYPSRTAFPEFNFTYDYGIRQSPWKNGKGDIAREFVDACRAYGLRPSFYSGVANNAYLNVVNSVAGQTRQVDGQVIVTQDQYTKIILANLRQQWTDYGELAEIWFDGGYPASAHDELQALLNELQPNAIVFQGPIGHKNVVRWVGTESGKPRYPVWSTANSSLDDGSGSPDAPVFVPAEADTCFTVHKTEAVEVAGPYPGCWFYEPAYVPKSLKTLVETYHATVGSNALLMLGFNPNQAGGLDVAHSQRYAEFGAYIEKCYGHGLDVTNTIKVATGNVTFGGVSSAEGVVDRIVVQEDLATTGEAVRTYKLFDVASGDLVASGSAIGHKRIMFLSKALPASSLLRLEYTFEGEVVFAKVEFIETCDAL